MTIDLYTWNTPNGRKISVALEEMGLPYKVYPVNISKGEQMAPGFLKISPNNKIPAIVDRDNSLALMESGAILIYLADKTGRFIPRDLRERTQVLEWLFWQMANLGPNCGQAHHFRNYAQDKIPYAIDRFTNEVNRLYGVMDTRLKDRDFLAGDYSIADMASYPWVQPERQKQNIDDFPHLKRWLETIRARPATERAYAMAKDINPNFGQPAIRTEEERKLLFGQTAAVVR